MTKLVLGTETFTSPTSPSTGSSPAGDGAGKIDVDRLVKLLECAAAVHNGDLPQRLKRTAEILVTAELKAMRRA